MEQWIADARKAYGLLSNNRDIDHLEAVRSTLAAFVDSESGIRRDQACKRLADDLASLYRQVCEELAQGPGKFEGEPAYVVPFWNALMEGLDDGNGLVEVEPVDRFIWSALKGKRFVRLAEDDQGFVYIN
jgi:hypothetical protein